jgi:hypothetical protein
MRAIVAARQGSHKCSYMKHRSIEYQVVEIIGGHGGHADWKWSVIIDAYTSAVGMEQSRTAAIAAAEKKIDRALAPKIAKANLVPRRD